MNWPIVQKTAYEFVIRIPRRQKRSESRPPDFRFMIGALADEFKGMTSVEVQHSVGKLWTEKFTS